MPALARPRPVRAASRRRAAGAVCALLAVAAVSTAAAPGVIRLSRGDTLSELAVRQGTTVAALRAANGLAPGERIYAGDLLTLPGSGSRTTETTHVVAAGENVTTIARRYGASVASVLSRNGLAADTLLLPGRSLVVPGTSTAAAAAPRVAGSVTSATARDRATLATRSVPSRTAVRALISAAARRYGVDPSLALSVAYQESGFQQKVVSEVDAIGVMQVLPSTGRVLSSQLGRPLDLLRTEDNVSAGVFLLRQLLRSQGSEHAALAGYYQGLGSLAAKGVLPQTTAYIASIDALRPRFANG